MQSLTIPDFFCDRTLLFSVSDYVVLQAGLLSASDCFSRLFFADSAEVLELVKNRRHVLHARDDVGIVTMVPLRKWKTRRCEHLSLRAAVLSQLESICHYGLLCSHASVVLRFHKAEKHI